MTVRRARPSDWPRLPPEAAATAADEVLFVALADGAPVDAAVVGFLRLSLVADPPCILALEVDADRGGEVRELLGAALYHAQARGAERLVLAPGITVPAPLCAALGVALRVSEGGGGLRVCELPAPNPAGILVLLEAGHTDQVRELLRASPVFGLDLSRLTSGRLTRQDLSGLSLRGARFGLSLHTQVDLEGADLTGASLNLTALWGSCLRGARLVEADLRGANLSGADLTGADLREACLRGAVLRRVCLQDADLSGADLRGADLREARLDGAIWVNVQVFGARFSPGRGLGAGPATGSGSSGCEPR